MEPTIMENQMEKNMENEMETLGPFKGRRFGQDLSRSHMLTLSGLLVFGNWTGMV